MAPHVHGAMLDIGCGRGYGFEIVAPRTTTQVGIDISKEFLTKARDQFAEISFTCASGDALPLAASSFDSVLAFDVIEHAQDDLHFLAELKRVARRGALIALSTPNRLVSSGKSLKPLDPFHVREYEAAEFYQLLSHFLLGRSVWPARTRRRPASKKQLDGPDSDSLEVLLSPLCSNTFECRFASTSAARGLSIS